MADNQKLTARVPIICADFENKDMHKDKELVMDYKNQDIYLKESDRYINITGRLKDQIQEIQDGSMVVHIVTENTLPPIKDRPENHWYFVITKSETIENGEEVNVNSYIYYGVVESNFFENASNYILTAQNMIADPASVAMTVNKGYRACFYVPTSYNPSFYNNVTGEPIPFTVIDRLYIVDNSLNSIIAVDVYLSDEEELGDVDIMIDYQGNMFYQIQLEPNESAITGLVMPDSPISVKVGSAIGSIQDPTWTELRYVFRGWSTNKLTYTAVDTTKYIPEKNMTLYAFFEYIADASLLAYSVSNVSEGNSGSLMRMSNATPNLEVLSQYTGVENKHVLIYPKTIEGYFSPSPVELMEDGQHIEFVYTPQYYDIEYEMSGGSSNELKYFYTVEEEYTPATPVKENNIFMGWVPEKIEKGTTGKVTFIAKWKEEAITLKGSMLNYIFDHITSTDVITSIMNGTTDHTDGILDEIMAINRVSEIPNSDLVNPINISSTSTPIYAWWVPETKAIHIYCEQDIICNDDMSGAFKGMSLLRTISGLKSWIVRPMTDLTELFYGDSLLTDTIDVNGWNPHGGMFTNAFEGTAAAEYLKVPEWYAYTSTILYYSATGKLLDSVTTEFVPNEEVYAKSFNGYITPSTPIRIVDNNTSYQFTYDPIDYSIEYDANGGNMVETKTLYTIEDEDYYPPKPIKDGFEFESWSPEYIPSGSTGTVKFVAIWK
ncbi:MAG: InlB B-repeat-containing protein [Clostridia bacterium]|nr:InlB B-repeat-containing protein [Clostridia bacterium]